jgi:hypothetical protein
MKLKLTNRQTLKLRFHDRAILVALGDQAEGQQGVVRTTRNPSRARTRPGGWCEATVVPRFATPREQP